MTAYLLKDGRHEFASHDVHDAWEGFQDLGEEVRPFSEAMLRNGVMGHARGDVICGWVRTVLLALDQLDVTPPTPLDYPAALVPWLHRRVDRATLASLCALTRPVFVKPADQAKLFDGRIVHPGDTITPRQSPDTPVWVSEVVDWRSEWRAYVSDGSVIGAFPYRGDWRLAPTWIELDAMVGAWTDAPCCYALDIGVLADGRTALIEANDAWALGNYGLLPIIYARLLRQRWDQLVGNVDTRCVPSG